VAIVLLLVILVAVICLNLLKVVLLEDSIIKIIFATFGFLLPYLKNAIEELENSTPWETYLTYLIKKEKLSQDTLVRISYSAFLIVEIDGKYLLVKNSHGLNLYQLPARTYGLSEEERVQMQIEFGAVQEDFIKKDYCDYRMLIPIKKVKAFYKRFCEKINPYEYSYQEIVNDIVEKCGMDASVFASSRIFFKKRKINKIAFSRYTNHYEMNVADICVLSLSEEQKSEIRKAVQNASPSFKLATLQEIKANGINVEQGKLDADIAVITYDYLL
jgi:hypothetical protein